MREPIKAKVVLPGEDRPDVVVRLSEADIERIAEAVLKKLQPVLVQQPPDAEPPPDAYFPVKRNPPQRPTSEY